MKSSMMTVTAQNPGSPPESDRLYTIGTVSRLTGVGPITLRAWERRYELIHPVRKESGHRLYTHKQIDRINRITALTAQGMRISQITLDMLDRESTDAPGETETDSYWKSHLASMISAIISFDEARLEELYNEALSLYPIQLTTKKLLKPLLVELGSRWETKDGSVAEEHFFAFYLRNKLGARFHHRAQTVNGPVLLLANLPSEYHEIALLIFALAANECGYRLINLGANMPLNELAYVAARTRCDAIVLSGVVEPSKELLDRDLPGLVKRVNMPVFIGGRSSVLACDAINRTGAEALGDDMELGLIRLGERLSRTSPA